MPSDPAFTALSGARALYGYFSAGAYEIEIPNVWNHELVVYMHGSQEGDPQPFVVQPSIRRSLIANGYAWAAGSYDRTTFITGIAADQTAALRDLFSSKVTPPRRTYLLGSSMGGAGALISAERYSDRYDGVLADCAVAGVSGDSNSAGETLVAAGLAVGVTQSELDSQGIDAILDKQILPALSDWNNLERFTRIWTELTGGPRPFAADGLRLKMVPALNVARYYVNDGLINNEATSYDLVEYPGANAAALRFRGSTRNVESDEFSGNLKVPTITLNITGEALVPISEAILIHERVASSQSLGRLSQRTVQAPDHCGFSSTEVMDAFSALVKWVEDARRPDGEDLSRGNLENIGRRFTVTPRLGSPEADAVTGATTRISTHGTLTIDGVSYEPQYLGVAVLRDGLITICSLEPYAYSKGTYSLTVASAAEMRGCGVEGAAVTLITLSHDKLILAKERGVWPSGTNMLELDGSFINSDQAAPFTVIFGGITDSLHRQRNGEATVEAYIGNDLCGVTSLPTIGRLSDTYTLLVSRSSLKSSCQDNAPITLSVDGVPATTGHLINNGGQGPNAQIADMVTK